MAELWHSAVHPRRLAAAVLRSAVETGFAAAARYPWLRLAGRRVLDRLPRLRVGMARTVNAPIALAAAWPRWRPVALSAAERRAAANLGPAGRAVFAQLCRATRRQSD